MVLSFDYPPCPGNSSLGNAQIITTLVLAQRCPEPKGNGRVIEKRY